MGKQNHLVGYGWFRVTAETVGLTFSKVVRIRGKESRIAKFESLCSNREKRHLKHGETDFTIEQLKPGDEGFGIQN